MSPSPAGSGLTANPELGMTAAMGRLSLSPVHPVTGHALMPGNAIQLPFSVVPLIYTGQVPPVRAVVVNNNSSPGSGGSGLALSSPSARPPGTLAGGSPDFSPPRGSLYPGRLDVRRQNATRIVRQPTYNPAVHHNHVDVGRIRDGIDVRTTASSTSRKPIGNVGLTSRCR